jgi:hypothetical protein
MSVIISELPNNIRSKIPNSIKSYKDEYELEGLPVSIRNIISSYLTHKLNVTYGTVFDCVPSISEYGDFSTISNVKNLVLEYLKNYFLVSPEDYPFDPLFGSRLKRYLHMRDTSLQQTMIGNEVKNIIDVISADLDVLIEVTSVNILPISGGAFVDYKIEVKVKINDVEYSLTLA